MIYNNNYPNPILPPQPSAPMGNNDNDTNTYIGSDIDIDPSSYQNELLQQGYTVGLIQAIHRNKKLLYHTYWIVDNSGSMLTLDGHRMIVDSNNNKKLKIISGCSRWKEMVDTVEYHIQLAALTRRPTTIRLLNHPGKHICDAPTFTIANTNNSSVSSTNHIDQELATALHIIHETQPNGVTPLTEHIIAIRQSIEPIMEQIRSTGQKVAIIIATDGCPTDRYGNRNSSTDSEFRNALRSLESLPVWIVVRLCTDEEAIVDYWNEIDNLLEINLEVLDDYVSESKEVYAKNPWLTYSLPIHRLREMGFYDKLLDMIDEQSLSKSDIHQFLRLLYGSFDCTADPDLDWDRFCTIVDNVQNQQLQQHGTGTQMQWNPIHSKSMPYIDIKRLRQVGQTKSIWSLGLW